MDIVEEIRLDKERGAQRLVSEYRAGLMSLAIRFCHDAGDAEELVNRTFAEVISGIDGFLEQSAFFTWMCQILINLHAKDIRRRSSSNEIPTGELPDVADESAEGGVFRELDASLLRDAIETLPEDIRKTLLLHYFMDMSVRDIARFLSLPTGTVTWRLHYARQMLAAKLGATAKKPAVKATLLALALCGLTALGAAGYYLAARGEARNDAGTDADVATTPTSSRDGEGAVATSAGEDARAPAANQSSANQSALLSTFNFGLSAFNQPTQENNAMNTMALRTFAASAALATATGAAIPTNAGTIAWWHFDEGVPPGENAAASTIAPDQEPTLYAAPEAMNGTTIYAAGSPDYEASAYAPTYTRPFRGRVIYDPVSDTYRTNSAAMRFVTAQGSYPAEYGGCLKTSGTQSLYAPIAAANQITVEAFVCTTGGSYNSFGPIAGSLDGDSFLRENWSICTEESGQIFVRLMGGTYRGNNNSYKKVNDGSWHHVAFTFDGTDVKVYVDYALDRTIANVGKTMSFGDNNATYIGGYDNFVNTSGTTIHGYRRFPGVIDEVRVSSVALAPEQFLRMQRFDADDADVARVSFEADEYGFMQNDNMNLSDNLGPNRNLAVFRVVDGADPSSYDTTTKAGAVIAPERHSDARPENVASYCQATNAAGKANYIQLPNVSTMIRGSDGAAASYTIETFFKTRGKVTGSSSNRQIIFKFGSQPLVNVRFNVISQDGKLLYSYRLNGTSGYYELSTARDLDDGNWHHMACVVNGTAETNNISFYIDYRLDRAFTGTLPDVGTASSLFFGSFDNGSSSWFDGWLDDIRVTRRALTPSKFLTTHPVGSGDASLLALFGQNYNFVCASNAAFSVTGVGEARTGGTAPTFTQDVCGTILLDGINGTQRASNQYSASFDKSRVVFPESDLFEAESYTVEFWAKFTGIVDANGAVAADSTSLAQHAPILGLVRSGSPSSFDWYIFRQKTNAKAIQMSILKSYPGWALPNIVVDGKWHHYAFTFQPKSDDDTKTSIQFFYDYDPYAPQTVNARIPYCFGAHTLTVGDGPYDEPNIQFKMDALRFSKGVLDPSQFLGCGPNPFVIVVR